MTNVATPTFMVQRTYNSQPACAFAVKCIAAIIRNSEVILFSRRMKNIEQYALVWKIELISIPKNRYREISVSHSIKCILLITL